MPTAKSASKRGNHSSISKATQKKSTSEQRNQMIAEAAYFYAEKRGFFGGDPMDDWLAAEAEIDSMLQMPIHH